MDDVHQAGSHTALEDENVSKFLPLGSVKRAVKRLNSPKLLEHPQGRYYMSAKITLKKFKVTSQKVTKSQLQKHTVQHMFSGSFST